MSKGIPLSGHRIHTKNRSDKKVLSLHKCNICKIEFGVKISQLKWRNPLYCSKKCNGMAFLKQKTITCAKCYKLFSVSKARKTIYCSRECANNSRKIINARWRNPIEIKKYMHNYTQKNRIKLNASKQIYKKLHRGKANELQRRRRAGGGSFSAQNWDAILSIAPYCLSCGTSKYIQADHVIALARGGRNDIDNIQPLCRSCNVRKGVQSTDYRTLELKKKMVEASYPITIEEV